MSFPFKTDDAPPGRRDQGNQAMELQQNQSRENFAVLFHGVYPIPSQGHAWLRPSSPWNNLSRLMAEAFSRPSIRLLFRNPGGCVQMLFPPLRDLLEEGCEFFIEHEHQHRKARVLRTATASRKHDAL